MVRTSHHDRPRSARSRRLAPLALAVLAALVIACSSPATGGAPGGSTVAEPDATDSIDPTTIPLAGSSDEAIADPASAEPAVAMPDRTVEESGGFRLTTLASAACVADGPADWTMTAPDKSDRADLMSPDGSLYAGYGIQAINTSLAGFASAYPPPLDDPDLYSDDPTTVAVAYSRIVAGAIGGASDLAAGEVYQATEDYLLATVQSSTHRGVVFYRASGFPGDGLNYSYALPMYFAFTTSERWDPEGLLVARVAASIRCSTQFQPPDDYFQVEARDDTGAADANGDDAGYNPQLGTESVHDPTTGENYLVDPSVNWSETGPDGPGYYVPKSGGNDYQKLEPGRSG